MKYIFSFLLLLSTSLSAQDLDYKNVPEKISQDFAKFANANPLDLDKLADLSDKTEFKKHDDKIYKRKNTPQEIVKHYKGKSGIKYLQGDDVVERKDTTDVGDLENDVRENFDQLEKRYVKTRPLPICNTDNTSSVTVSKSSNDQSKRLQMDVLFIPKEFDQHLDDYAKLFGKYALVRIYDNDENTGLHHLGATLKIECLPTRFRMTNKFLFTDTGLNALKNYTKDQHAEGELIDESLKDLLH